MSANDIQVGGEHYRSEYQHWDFVAEVLDNRYFEGQITKYVTRWRKKNGVEDLKKGLHFLDKLIELYERELISPLISDPEIETMFADDTYDYCVVNGIEMGTLDHTVIMSVSCWSGEEDLKLARDALATVIAELSNAPL